MNKTRQVEYYMLNGHSITSWEAIEKFGATRLSAIIWELRKKYTIEAVKEEFVDRNGNTGRYSRYAIIGKRDVQKEAQSLLDKLKFWR